MPDDRASLDPSTGSAAVSGSRLEPVTASPTDRIGPGPLDMSGLVQNLVKNGLEGLPLEEQLSAFSKAVAASGFPMKRVNMGMRTLHPNYGALTYLWRPGMERAEFTPQDRTILGSDAYKRSPINYMLTSGRDTYRCRLDTGESLPFPILEEIRDEGMSDYAACIVRYDPAAQGNSTLEGVFFSCATDEPNGFDVEQLRQVFEVLPHLAVAIKSRLTYEVAKTVAETYLGKDAGDRVLTGEIERGSARSIDAVIWFCDLRGFTHLSDRLDRDELVALLNQHLEILARPVQEHGGQILKFMGDGFLATFDLTEKDPAAVCKDALAAALELRTSFAAFSRTRVEAAKPTLGFGLALHVGEVSYGNIGTDDRLDFTIVGRAVNEASRIQDYCRPLKRDLLISRAFQRLVDRSPFRLESIGDYELRGVSSAQELFTLAAS
jgi:adenylate cyclase